ncbi:uncharacterized protein LOC119681970 [Teleopsis dalmanni]|uniref:uncharacterized protein LOC119681970 n=1 Tax=Teleopsis dalmanni TaxID=139649 RepID=UPI0018CCF7DC|nr:uncharacterized protein LOC119681970 [Teleopsis dalmanni]
MLRLLRLPLLIVTTAFLWDLPVIFAQLPPIECPQYFRYLRSNNENFGLVTLPNSLYTGGRLNVNVKLSQREIFNGRNFGLALYESLDRSVQNIQNGESVQYRFNFPTQSEIPKLTGIVVNGETICSGSGYSPPNINFNAEHTISYPSGRRPVATAPNPPPSSSVGSSGGSNYGSSGSCASYFKYERANNENYGVITLPNQLFTGGKLRVEGKLIQNNIFNHRNFGVSLYKSLDDSVRDINNGRPVMYRFKFPEQNELPRIQEINVNNNRICNSGGDSSGSMRFSAEHTISWTDSGRRPSVPSPVPSPVPAPPAPPPQPIIPEIPDDLNNICGRKIGQLTPFIHHGREAKPGQFPWLAAVFHREADGPHFICGGSLISARTVITAAHCFLLQHIDKNAAFIELGSYNRTDSRDTAIAVRIDNIVTHPNYNEKQLPDADIAVVHLSTTIRFNDNISPICLWTEKVDLFYIKDQEGIVAGWGSLENNVLTSPTPRYVSARIVDNDECVQSADGFRKMTTRNTLCAGNRDNSGPCSGDSGSGLILRRDNHWTLRAIVSLGQTVLGRCNLNQFVIYTDVAKHITWVRTNILY